MDARPARALPTEPTDEAEARAMLRRLSGETHTVFTGLALLHRASGESILSDRLLERTGLDTKREADLPEKVFPARRLGGQNQVGPKLHAGREPICERML